MRNRGCRETVPWCPPQLWAISSAAAWPSPLGGQRLPRPSSTVQALANPHQHSRCTAESRRLTPSTRLKFWHGRTHDQAVRITLRAITTPRLPRLSGRQPRRSAPEARRPRNLPRRLGARSRDHDREREQAAPGRGHSAGRANTRRAATLGRGYLTYRPGEDECQVPRKRQRPRKRRRERYEARSRGVGSQC